MYIYIYISVWLKQYHQPAMTGNGTDTTKMVLAGGWKRLLSYPQQIDDNQTNVHNIHKWEWQHVVNVT